MALRAACMAMPTLCMLVCCAGVHAQSKNEDTTTRTVEGKVTNAADQPVADAVVQLKNTKTLQIRSFITQEDGTYHFAGLGSDVEYELKAGHNGTSTSWKSLSVFNTKKTATINLKLKK
ncbi:MAG: carboxypeptidase regulatory-like domain-containing protein [Bryobacterales bacterium]|nr:carboxypeptidase regulatory-like domain-containing protein [Bryobacterales bacterium]